MCGGHVLCLLHVAPTKQNHLWVESSQASISASGSTRAPTGRRRTLPPLDPITLHECRHTFASLMIAADVNAKALSAYMGHASVTITLDRYGHLMPGNEDEAAGLLDAYLARADTRARLAQVTES